MNLCIISCGAKKIWDENPNIGPTKAKDVYVGPFFNKCKEYAEKFYASSWCILSAKYGFIFPEEIIPETYNVSFNNKKTNPITLNQLLEQVKEKKLNYDEVIVLGGKNYINMISKIFLKISTPLKGCKGIGYMMGKLKNLIETMEKV